MNSQQSSNFQKIPITWDGKPDRYIIQTASLFQGRLYIGIASDPSTTKDSGTAYILSYQPTTKKWQEVYTIKLEYPGVNRSDQRLLFPELGFRSMKVFRTTDHSTSVLCATLLAAHASKILYSVNGQHFQELPNPGNSEKVGVTPFTQLYAFSGRVFASPAGALKKPDSSPQNTNAMLYVTDNPFSSNWCSACSPGFGEEHNQVIYSMQIFNGQLYVAVANSLSGFQLFKTTAVGSPPFNWEKVLDCGAQLYTLNPAITSMVVFNNALYLGTGIPGTEPAKVEAKGAEIIRVFSDGKWELVMGVPRFSPIGLQVPISTYGPGFSDNTYTVVSSMIRFQDTLYAALGRRDKIQSRLWKTVDGETWQPVTTADNTDLDSSGSIRILLSTPDGVLVAANKPELGPIGVESFTILVGRA